MMINLYELEIDNITLRRRTQKAKTNAVESERTIILQCLSKDYYVGFALLHVCFANPLGPLCLFSLNERALKRKIQYQDRFQLTQKALSSILIALESSNILNLPVQRYLRELKTAFNLAFHLLSYSLFYTLMITW